jgi:hypothetical protein
MSGKTYRLKLKSKRGTRRSKIHRKKSNTKRRHVRRSSRRGGMRAVRDLKKPLTDEERRRIQIADRKEVNNLPKLPSLTENPNSLTYTQPSVNLFKNPQTVNVFGTNKSSINIPEHISTITSIHDDKSNDWLSGPLGKEELHSRKRNSNSVRLQKL